MTREYLNDEELKTCFARFTVMRKEGDFHSEEYKEVCAELTRLLKIDGGVFDTFLALFKKGPLDAGDLPSKGGRDSLAVAGMCVPVISNGSWSYALVGSLDAFWTYFCEHEEKKLVGALAQIHDYHSFLTSAREAGRLAHLQVMHYPVGAIVPESMQKHTISFDDLISIIKNNGSAPATKFVVIYKKLPTKSNNDDNYLETRADYFINKEGTQRVPEVIHFLSEHTVACVNDGLDEYEIKRSMSGPALGRITREEMLLLIGVCAVFE